MTIKKEILIKLLKNYVDVDIFNDKMILNVKNNISNEC